MPRTGQIIPRYLVPHVSTYINNNTEEVEVEAVETTDPKIGFVCVFPSSRGEDGTVKTFTRWTDFVKEYGQPDFKKYGQANLMPYTLLRTGLAKCHCLRVAASDAKCAVSVVSAYVKESTETKQIPRPDTNPVEYDNVAVKYIDVKFVNEKISGGLESSTRETVEKAVAGLKPKEADSEGYFHYPLFAVVSKGKGEYGNTFSFKLVSDIASNRSIENQYINYNFEVHDLSSGTDTVIEQFSGTLNDPAVISKQTLFLDDVVADPTNGSRYVRFVTLYDNIDEFIDKCNTLIKGFGIDNPPLITCTTFDIIHGLDKAGNPLKDDSGNVIYKINEDGVNLDHKTDTIHLAGGSDGKFVSANKSIDTSEVDKEIINALTNNAQIRSKRRTPADLILDANYSKDVKHALVQCSAARGDAILVLDSGTENKTISDVTAWWDDFESDDTISDYLNDYTVDKETQAYRTRDPFTGKIITVTITYLLAQLLPAHFINIGRHVPFVGSTYASLTNYIKDSLYPVIDADDLSTKDYLYTRRLNFFEAIGEDSYARATQVSSDPKWSDLSELNNVAVLLNMKRILEDFCTRRLYDFASAEDRIRFTERADALFTNYRNREVSSYNVYFDMNEFEQNKSILHCYLSVVFRTLGKRCIVEIDINKRNTTTTE